VPGVSRFVRKLAPAYDSSRHFSSNFFGLTYVGDLSEFIDWNIFFFGAYAKGELAFLARCAEILTARFGEFNFFDVGANAGQHSLFMCRRVREVHAFEPSAATAKRFQHNISINSLRNVFLYPIALADTDSEAILGSGFRGNSGSRSLNWSLPGGLTEKVQVRNADMYFRERRLPRMHLLKIDVEGHEKKVLQGLRHRLRTDRPLIVMELIGAPECKGGFRSEYELRSDLYPEHELRSLVERRGRYRLTRFDWNCESVVVLPSEVCAHFLP
jgi:FkbM family methyltransferase